MNWSKGVFALQYNELIERYPDFIYHGYRLTREQNIWRVVYDFETVGLTEFHPSWTLPARGIDPDDPTFREFLFSIGMVELISYWKATCSPRVRPAPSLRPYAPSCRKPQRPSCRNVDPVITSGARTLDSKKPAPLRSNPAQDRSPFTQVLIIACLRCFCQRFSLL